MAWMRDPFFRRIVLFLGVRRVEIFSPWGFHARLSLLRVADVA